MNNHSDQGYTIQDLEVQKIGLEDRIKRLEADLKCPLEANSSEQAGQISNMIILRRILEVEKSNLRKVKFELEKRYQAGLHA